MKESLEILEKQSQNNQNIDFIGEGVMGIQAQKQLFENAINSSFGDRSGVDSYRAEEK